MGKKCDSFKECCVLKCQRTSNDRRKTVVLHRFPQAADQNRLNLWILAVREHRRRVQTIKDSTPWMPGARSRICSNHFGNEMFARFKRKELFKHAVPLKFPNFQISSVKRLRQLLDDDDDDDKGDGKRRRANDDMGSKEEAMPKVSTTGSEFAVLWMEIGKFRALLENSWKEFQGKIDNLSQQISNLQATLDHRNPEAS